MERLNQFIHDVGKLKRKDRAGWVRHGVENPESVAEHSFRTAILALVLSDKFGLDSNKTVKMALVHDLAEAQIPDFTPFDNLSTEEKFKLEQETMKNLCANITNGEQVLELWYELEAGKTKEARFVKKLDKLEMMFQAREYGDEQPDKDLELFWQMIQDFDFDELSSVFEELISEKERQSGASQLG